MASKGRSRACSGAIALALALVPLTTRADNVGATVEAGFARLTFTLDPAAHATTDIDGGALTIAFDRKVALDPSALKQGLAAFVTSARADADGKRYHLALAQRLRVHQSAAADKLAIDLVPVAYAGTPPDLPQPKSKAKAPVDPASLAPVKLRVGAYQHFTRLVFDWPKTVAYSVFPGAGKLGVRFAALARPDFTLLERLSPPWVKNAAWRIDGDGIVVEFETDQASAYHDFRDGPRVVLDVLAPKTDADADAYTPPGGAKVKATPLTPAQSANAMPQAQAIPAAAAKLAGKPVAAAQTPALPTQPAPAAVAQQQPAAPAPAPAAASDAAVPQNLSADGKVVRDSAVLRFAGAARLGSAVFIRGDTAWIVLATAAPLDAVRLKTELGDFPQTMEAASGNGLSILRIGLAKPEQIAAFADGSDLKVVIAPSVDANASAINFSRNGDDDAHATMTTLLAGARRVVTLLDPVAGDTLTVVPAAAGQAMAEDHSYVEFRALQTASGLVVLPYCDSLDVSVDNTRVTIARNGGLSLTMQTAAASPLARANSGASFIDFAAWRRGTASFLDTERKLRANVARQNAGKANPARLALARFYLANDFAAEALGMLTLMQAADPALQGDKSVRVMRAVADYEMGRYGDAHNEIAGAAFDSDPHAALWRGLIAVELEDWDTARADLDLATAVLRRYPVEWQGRARLAAARAGLARNRLELADAALARLPPGLPNDLMTQAQLLRARLLAQEHREREARVLFAAVEASGNEHAAAEAIYAELRSRLASGAISRAKAIDVLENLRFRWRGDSLELATLRKLSSLYFAAQRWREGLHTLRIAARSFPGDESARKAEDDMRAAFVDLFLHGKADKMPPVEALSLFYDNIDLTPIGADGDEMIRRMANRLVAVDLLGPAADLLKYQVDKRLDGVARAQVATTLAGIYLMDAKPQDALDTLRATQIATLPDDVGHKRLLLEARALAALKRPDDALDLISVDKQPDTARLRADIYWQSGQWQLAGASAEDELGNRWNAPAPLAVDERHEVLRAAVAFSLAGDETGLERLRAHFATAMAGTPDAAAFAAVTAPIDAHGTAFREAAAEIASVDTLQSFMKQLQAGTR